jgi:hypothetical protein
MAWVLGRYRANFRVRPIPCELPRTSIPRAHVSRQKKRRHAVLAREVGPPRELSEEKMLPRFDYLDDSGPDIAVLRRQDSTFVAAFSAQGR